MLSNLPKVMVNTQKSWDLKPDSRASKAQIINHFFMLLIIECLGLKLWQVITTLAK